MPDFTAFEAKRHSQNGEDGVIGELCRRIGAPRRWFVEFGIEGGTEGNCVTLADDEGWHGLFIESDREHFDRLQAKYASNARVHTMRAVVRPESLEGLLAAAGVPREPDVFSIDIDSNDYYVWRSLKAYRPRIVVIEYNADLPLDRRLVLPYNPGHQWDETDYYGASLPAYEVLGVAKGYRLVHTDATGVNAFFVRQDIIDTTVLDGTEVPRRAANFFGSGRGHPRDPQDRPWVDLDAGGKLTRLSDRHPGLRLRGRLRALAGRRLV